MTFVDNNGVLLNWREMQATCN